MLASILIVTLAVVLLIYWFRYACTLALSSQKEPASVARVAAVNGLTFLSVHAELCKGDRETLDDVCKSLDHDYQVLLYLLRHAFSRRHFRTVEQSILVWDYRLMRIWYGCVRRFSTVRARSTLAEQSRILTSLAHYMAQRNDCQFAA
jgi:hypothetical protein